MTTTTKLIDKARELDIGKRTLQSWGELGCPVHGTAEEIRHWRSTTTELERPRSGRRKHLQRLTMDQCFERLWHAIDSRKHEISFGDTGKPHTLAEYDELDEFLKACIRSLWDELSDNRSHTKDTDARFEAWFARALEGQNDDDE